MRKASVACQECGAIVFEAEDSRTGAFAAVEVVGGEARFLSRLIPSRVECRKCGALVMEANILKTAIYGRIYASGDGDVTGLRIGQ